MNIFRPAGFRKRFHGFIIFFVILIATILSFSEVKAALSLLSGRTYDEAHDLGYIDWSGSVGYANIFHRDSICPSTCVDTVSQISNGSQVSGVFDRDVGSFNVLVAMVPGQGYGTLTLTTCGVTSSANLNAGTGSTPGYVKVFVSGVPSTCRTWSASASGGTVYLAAVDVTYSVPALLPPTISGSLPCSVPGANSWCVSGLSLDLTASDPQGYSLIISGDINSATFSCTAGVTSCSVPISTEGSATANFKATSSVALSSSGSVVYKLDGTAPQLTGTTSGASGNLGWFISDVDFSLSATDVVSGVALVETRIDGGAWTTYTAPLTLTDGLHSVQSRATDYAGNVTPIETQTINIDTLTPLITPTVSGVMGLNSWYVSSVQVSAVASDTGSGLATFEANVDSGGWVAYTAPITLTDGIHSVQFRATDQAGNLTTSPAQTIQVDTLTPTLSLPITGTAGLNGWYVSNTQVTVTAGDAGSGIFSTEALQDGALYAPYTVPLSFTEGQHTYQVKAIDMAGNITETAVLTMNVDTIFPLVTLTPAITLGDAALYTLMDNGSQLAYLNSAISDSGGLFTPLAWSSGLTGSVLTDQFVWDGKFAGGINAPPGTYQATLKIMDAAGNETVAVCDITINVLSFIQPVPPFHPPSGAVYHPVIPTASPAVVFGGNVSVPPSEPSTVTVAPAGGIPITGVIASMQSWTQIAPSTTLPPLSASTVLWGAASAAAVGFFLIDAQKRKEEEEARLAEAQRLIDEREAQARVALDALHDKERESLVILQSEYERAEAERKAEEQRAREEKLAARAAAAAQKLAEKAWAAAQQVASTVVTKVQNTLKPSTPSKASTPSIMAAMTSTAQKPPASIAAKAKATVGTVAKVAPKVVAAPTPVVSKAPAKTSLFNSITSAVSKVTTSIASTVKKVMTPVVNTVKKVVTPVVNTVKKVVTPIASAVTSTVKKVVTPVVNTVKKVVTPIASAITSTVKKIVTPIINTVKKVATKIVDTAVKVGTAIVQKVVEVGTAIVEKVKEIGTAIIEKVKDVGNAIVTAAVNVKDAVVDAFQEHPVAAWSTAIGGTAAIAATVYYIDNCGLPVFTPPVSSLFNLAKMSALPLTGLLTTYKKKRLYGILVGMLMLGMILSACGGGVTPSGSTSTPTLCPPTPTATQTPTIIPPTATITPDPSLIWTYLANSGLTVESLETNYPNLKQTYVDGFLRLYGPYLPNTTPYDLQNAPNQILWDAAEHYGLPPIFLKAICMTESQCVLNPIADWDPTISPYPPTSSFNYDAGGIMQVTPNGGYTIFDNLSGSPDANAYYKNIYAYLTKTQSWSEPVPSKDNYSDLSSEQKEVFQNAVQTIYNGQCDDKEANVGICTIGVPLVNDMQGNIELGALGIVATNKVVTTYIGQDTWNNLPNAATTQALILAAGYKMGAYGTGQAAQDAKDLNNGQPPSWAQIGEQIATSDYKCSTDYQNGLQYPQPGDCAANYAEKMLCYAESMSTNSNVDCTLQSSWDKNWIR